MHSDTSIDNKMKIKEIYEAAATAGLKYICITNHHEPKQFDEKRMDYSLDEAKIADDEVKLEIRDGWYYINGEKTYINTLGYEIGARPGQHPKEPRAKELVRMKNDLNLIKEAGFNAIRIWADLSEEEVKLVQASGLYLIFGIETNQYADFSDPEFVDEALYIVDSIVSYTRNYNCIISYL